MAIPSTSNLVMTRGDSYRHTYLFFQDEAETTPLDLTGCTARAQIRVRADDPSWAAMFEVEITPPNTILVSMSADMAAKLPSGSGVWDLEVTGADGWVSTLVAGTVTVKADVTRSN